MSIPTVVPGGASQLSWPNMTSLVDGSVITDATVTAEIFDKNSTSLQAGIALDHNAAGSYYGTVPVALTLTEGEYYFIEYTAQRGSPLEVIGKSKVLVQANDGAAAIPPTDYCERLSFLRDNTLKALECLVGQSGCPQPDYKVKGFEMNWSKLQDELIARVGKLSEELERCSGHFECVTPGGTQLGWGHWGRHW